MVAKLKVFQTVIGLRTWVVAASSQKAALKAWDIQRDLFANGEAAETKDPAAIMAALDVPGIPVALKGVPSGVLEQAIKALEKRGMLKDTLVIFHAGTGGAIKRKYPTGDGDPSANVASNGAFKGGRGGLHEGGVRAAAFVWWPGQVQTGICTELLHVVDLYPTLLKLAGVAPQQTKPIDGVEAWDTIARGKPSPRQEVLINVEEFRGALRMGDWKLIWQATLPSKLELFNLRADPSEEDNLAERDPERVRAMQKRLTEYAWDMTPSRYLEELARPKKVDVPIYWGENPARP